MSSILVCVLSICRHRLLDTHTFYFWGRVLLFTLKRSYSHMYLNITLLRKCYKFIGKMVVQFLYLQMLSTSTYIPRETLSHSQIQSRWKCWPQQKWSGKVLSVPLALHAPEHFRCRNWKYVEHIDWRAHEFILWLNEESIYQQNSVNLIWFQCNVVGRLVDAASA